MNIQNNKIYQLYINLIQLSYFKERCTISYLIKTQYLLIFHSQYAKESYLLRFISISTQNLKSRWL